MTISLHAFLMALYATHGDPQARFVFSHHILPGIAPVEFARNHLVQHFLERTRADYIWFIDDDVVPTATSAEMLKIDADIVSGRCWIWREDEHSGTRFHVSSFQRDDHPPHRFRTVKPSDPDDVIKDVDAAGAACLLIKRSVFEDPRMRLDPVYTTPEGETKSLDDEPGPPAFFRTVQKPNGERYWGEDIDFVWRAKQLGYSAKVHLGASFGHIKEMDLGSVAEMFARSMQGAGA